MSSRNNYSMLLLLLPILAVLPRASEAARILGYFPTTTTSHTIIHCAVADALAQAGHDVTVIGAVPNVNTNATYKYIHMGMEGFSKEYTKEIINKPKSLFKGLLNLAKNFVNIANDHMKQPKMKQFLQEHGENSFDLVILGWIMNDFQLGLAAHFKCPIILSFMVQPMYYINYLFGNPEELAYVPINALQYKQPMNFWERVVSFVFYGIVAYVIEPIVYYYNEVYYNLHFPAPTYPPFKEMKKNVSLIFANHHQISQGPIRPNVPAVIEIGGIQIKEQTDPLPSDIATILDKSINGVIYFSLGSSVQGNALDEQKARIMFNVLSKLPYTVLWKWGDSPVPGVSPNIIYKSWVPQVDVLAHPNVKLFITHGGLGSVVESQFHGVPMVGLPLFAGQPGNIAKVERSGFGLRVDYLTLSEESFQRAILKVIRDPKYKNAVTNFSKLYRDRPMSPRQTVVYWTEYVLRHNGAKHLQSPAVHMNVFQLCSLDVIAFLLAVSALVLWTSVKIVKVLCSRKFGWLKTNPVINHLKKIK